MNSNDAPRRGGQTTQVVYDKVSGRIIGRFSRFDVTKGGYDEADAEDVLASFRRDEALLARVTDRDPRNLAVTATDLEESATPRFMRVSPASGLLEALPRIRLSSDRDVLEGDGEDSVTLTIAVVGERDAVVSGFDAEIKVSTTHGKLSTRAGLVRAEKGRASLTLTSTRETIDEVRVRAIAADGSAQPAQIKLRFE